MVPAQPEETKIMAHKLTVRFSIDTAPELDDSGLIGDLIDQAMAFNTGVGDFELVTATSVITMSYVYDGADTLENHVAGLARDARFGAEPASKVRDLVLVSAELVQSTTEPAADSSATDAAQILADLRAATAATERFMATQEG
jgi:hypothetical protein